MEKMLFESALGIEKSLYIKTIKFNKEEGRLDLEIDFKKGAKFGCSECGEAERPVHDCQKESWRHLNFFQYQCHIHFRNPRIKCGTCGTVQWKAPWSRSQSGFTQLFEAFILTLAKEMPILKIAELVGEHDTRLWRIIHHHVGEAYAKKDFSHGGFMKGIFW